jgi:hypothetical protein
MAVLLPTPKSAKISQKSAKNQMDILNRRSGTEQHRSLHILIPLVVADNNAFRSFDADRPIPREPQERCAVER